jgi:hypothetical protein
MRPFIIPIRLYPSFEEWNVFENKIDINLGIVSFLGQFKLEPDHRPKSIYAMAIRYAQSSNAAKHYHIPIL